MNSLEKLYYWHMKESKERAALNTEFFSRAKLLRNRKKNLEGFF